MKKQSKAVQMKQLRSALRYWQMQRRIEMRWVKMSEARCKEVALEMRKLQREQVKI